MQQIQPTDALRGVLECEGVALESAFCDDAEPRAFVLVYRVSLPGTRPLEEPGLVVKFSQIEHALSRAEFVQIATPEHYRRNYEDAEGIHDEMEAKHREQLRPSLSRNGASLLSGPGLRPTGGHVIYAVDDIWMFCTSVKPSSGLQLVRIAKRFSRESATTIREPSRFAQELGAAFLAHPASRNVKLSSPDRFVEHVSQPYGIGTVVWVYHGPVLYSDDAQDLVSSFPDDHRAIPIAFIKRRKYDWECEYRFTVHVRGAPSNEVVRLPVSDELRKLTHIEWELSHC